MLYLAVNYISQDGDGELDEYIVNICNNEYAIRNSIENNFTEIDEVIKVELK